jgi:hypothetical protein
LISCSDVCEIALPLSLHFVEGDYGPAAAVAQLSFCSYHHERREKHTLLSCFMFCELALPLLLWALMMSSTIELLYTSWKRRACLVAWCSVRLQYHCCPVYSWGWWGLAQIELL